MKSQLLKIKRMEVGTNKSLSIQDSFVTQEQLDAMNEAAKNDATGYWYAAIGYASSPEAPKVGSPETPTDKERIQAALEIIHAHQDDDQRSVGPETTIRMLRELLEGEWGEEENEGGEVTPKPRGWTLLGLGPHGVSFIGNGPKIPLNEYVKVREVLNGEIPSPPKGIDFSALARMPKPDPEVTHYLPMYEAGPNTCRYCQMDRSEHEMGGECPIKGCTLEGPPQEGGEG